VRNNLDIYIGRNNEVIEVQHNQHQNFDSRISKVGYFEYTDSISDAEPHYDRKYGNVKEKDKIYELYSISSAEPSKNERSHFSQQKSKSPEKSLELQTKICPDESKEDICKELNYTCSMYDRDLTRVMTKSGNLKSPSTIFDADTSEFLGDHLFDSESINNESAPTQDPRVKKKCITKYQNFRMNLLSKKNKSVNQQAKFLLGMRQDIKENLGSRRFASNSVGGNCEGYGPSPEAYQFSSKLNVHPQA
jgi:hypothetical protein